jgi:hypothetical protein
MSPILGIIGSQYVPPPATRAVFAGGDKQAVSVRQSAMQYFDVGTLSNYTSFGNLLAAEYLLAGCGSATRGVFSGGADATVLNTIQYITIATTGNATSFGTLIDARYGCGAFSSSTRGCIGLGVGGPPGYVNIATIEYITIATTGNGTSFGNATSARGYLSGVSSTTRGVFAMGYSTTAFDYVTIATTGNATSFGNFRTTQYANGGGGSSTRGLFFGGDTGSPPVTNIIDYITIATTGNTTSFGTMTAIKDVTCGASSPTRTLIAGGSSASIATNVVEYVTTATTGNGTDFGDLVDAVRGMGGVSNGHGGL